MPTKKNPLHQYLTPKKPAPQKPAKPDFVALAAAKIDCKARDLIEYRLYPTYIVIIGPAYTKHTFPLADLDPDFVSEYL